MAHDEMTVGLARLARRMAQSGQFCSWRLIQIELRFIQGIRAADALFADMALRSELDELCRLAQKRPRSSARIPLKPLAGIFPAPARPRYATGLPLLRTAN